mgnify:FL=1
MSTDLFVILGIATYLLSIVTIGVVLYLMSSREKKKYRKQLDELERDKNLIVSANLMAEFNKVEPLVQGSDMQDSLSLWKKRFQTIKDTDVNRITDALLEAEELFTEKKYKELSAKLSDIEFDIYYVKTNATFLLDEIKEITLSEEKNRETITKLKANYRAI